MLGRELRGTYPFRTIFIETIEDIIEVYRKKDCSICLFTGAGVSYTQDANYCAPGWRQLLQDVLVELRGVPASQEAACLFAELESKSRDLWHLASAIKSTASSEGDFVRALRKAVLRRNETTDAKKQLKEHTLRGAATLNAVIAFCSQVTRIRKHPCFAVNPRIRAVLTANYDWFLEAGATRKHQARHFKPMTRVTSSVQKNQMPVYHIHGYFPFVSKREPGVPLILDHEAYEQAYATESWTRQIIAHFPGQYATLFLGFSFEDDHFRAELQRHAARGAMPPHFALLREADRRPPGLLDAIEKAGVRPVFYQEHGQVPDWLGLIYQAALPQGEIPVKSAAGQTAYFSREEVWQMLLQDKRWKPAMGTSD